MGLDILQKGTKTALETTRTFATLFADMDIRQRLVMASSVENFRATLLQASSLSLLFLQNSHLLNNCTESFLTSRPELGYFRFYFTPGILYDYRLPKNWLWSRISGAVGRLPSTSARPRNNSYDSDFHKIYTWKEDNSKTVRNSAERCTKVETMSWFQLGPGKWYPGRGLKDDFQRRLKHYASDYIDGTCVCVVQFVFKKFSLQINFELIKKC